MKRLGKFTIFGLIALIILCIVLFVIGQTTQSTVTRPTATPAGPPTPDIGDATMAQVMCQNFVTERLKSPASADFGGMLDDRDEAYFVELERADELGIDVSNLRNSGLWVVAGSVDSQNALGVMLRSKYVCYLDYDAGSGEWLLVEIGIE